MKNKTPHLLKSLKATVLNLWERDYNSKILFKPTVDMLLSSAKKRSTFDSFLQADKNLFIFDITVPINCYHNYCSNYLTSFLKYLDVVFWWDIYGTHDNPISLMACNMIVIPAMSLECKKIFSSTNRLITLVQNCLKKNIIEAYEYLRAWYKQDSTF